MGIRSVFGHDCQPLIDELRRRAETAERRVVELEAQNLNLIDRVLARHGSRPISPAEEPPSVPSPSVTPLDEARRQDIAKEWFEYHGLREHDMTPHLREELDRFLDEEMQRPMVTTWPQ